MGTTRDVVANRKSRYRGIEATAITLSQFMVHKSPSATIAALCKSVPSGPFDRAWLDKTVKDALKETPSNSSAELRRSKWELALKNEVFMLAVRLSVSSLIFFRT